MLFHAVLLGLAGAALLWGIYRGVETRWPNQYLGMTQTFGLSARSTLVRFVGYRFLPHALAVLVVSVTAERVTGLESLAVTAGWICGGVSVAITNLWAAFAPLIRPREFKVQYAGYHLFVVMALVISTGVVVGKRDYLESVIPSPEALLEGLWGGALALGGGGLVLSALRSRPYGSLSYGPEYWIQRCERLVGLKEMDLAFEYAVRWRADPMLYKSIMVAEVIQRPRWWRIAEFLAARFGATLTVGTMQVSSTFARTEDRAKRVAAHALADSHGWVMRDGHIDVDWGAVWGAGTRQNAEGEFADGVMQIYQHLLYASSTVEKLPAAIIETRRYADVIQLRGVVEGAQVAVYEMADDGFEAALGEIFDSKVIPRAATGPKWSFALQVPISKTTVGLVVTMKDGYEKCARLTLSEGRMQRMEYVEKFYHAESSAHRG